MVFKFYLIFSPCCSLSFWCILLHINSSQNTVQHSAVNIGEDKDDIPKSFQIKILTVKWKLMLSDIEKS